MKGKIGESRRGEQKATETGLTAPGDEERRSQPVQSILAAHMNELETDHQS